MALWATVEVNLAVTAGKWTRLSYWLVLSRIAIVCLPSLRPIYRRVFSGSLKSTQRSGTYSTSWNNRSNHQPLNSLKRDFSDSTRELAGMDTDGNRSFTEGLGPSSQGCDITCEMDNLSPHQTPKERHGIIVKSEVDVKQSARNGAAHSWLLYTVTSNYIS
jgi:hypothetical protein